MNQLEVGDGFNDAFADLCHQILASSENTSLELRAVLKATGPVDCGLLLYIIPFIHHSSPASNPWNERGATYGRGGVGAILACNQALISVWQCEGATFDGGYTFRRSVFAHHLKNNIPDAKSEGVCYMATITGLAV